MTVCIIVIFFLFRFLINACQWLEHIKLISISSCLSAWLAISAYHLPSFALIKVKSGG
jgi:hypothetical protein